MPFKRICGISINPYLVFITEFIYFFLILGASKGFTQETKTSQTTLSQDTNSSEENNTFKLDSDLNKQLIKIDEINFVGNTVFSKAQLRKAISSLDGEELTVDKLISLRTQITDLYSDNGYISSAAFLPPQEITDGKITFQIIEGILADVVIKGRSRLSEKYFDSRLPKIGTSVKLDELNASLKKLKNDPLIEELKASLKQSELGKNVLVIDLKENKSFTTSLSTTNSYSSSIGSLGGTIGLNYHVLGLGDFVNLDYTKTEGLDRFAAGYSLPVNSQNGQIKIKYTTANTEIIEEPVSALDIQADYKFYEIGFTQPIIQSDNNNLIFSVELEHIDSETFINNDFSFPFVDGLEDGVSEISVIRLIQEFYNQQNNSSFALRSQFNVGLDLFDSTVTTVGTDSLFWSWQGQSQWLQKIDDILLVSSLKLQLSEDRLLPLEQIAIGGINSVRGYRSNLSLGDNGVIGTLELQIPLLNNRSKINLIPFIDAGTVWSDSRTAVDANTLASIGLGVSYQLGNTIEARINYGIPLINVDAPEDISTTQPFSFQFTFQP